MFTKLFRSRHTLSPKRKPFRPLVVGLETRLATANVDWINPADYDANGLTLRSGAPGLVSQLSLI